MPKIHANRSPQMEKGSKLSSTSAVGFSCPNDLDQEDPSSEKVVKFADIVDLICETNKILHPSKTPRIVRRKCIERVFAPSTSFGLSCALPWLEAADEFLKDSSYKISNESGSLCTKKFNQLLSQPSF